MTIATAKATSSRPRTVTTLQSASAESPSRAASTAHCTGFACATACIHDGIRFCAMNVAEQKTSGSVTKLPMPIIASSRRVAIASP